MSQSKIIVKPITSASDVKLEIGENKKYSTSNGNYNSYNITPNPFIVKMSKCKIIGIYQSRPKGNENEQKRARIFISIDDPETLEIMKKIDELLVNQAIKHKIRLFNEYDDDSLIKENYKSILRYNEKYNSYSAYLDVSFKEWNYEPAKLEDYLNDRTVHENVDYNTLNEVLKVGSIVDLGVSVRRGNIDLSTDEYNLKYFVDKINIIGFSDKGNGGGEKAGVTHDTFDPSKLTFTAVEKNKTTGTKLVKINYPESRFTATFRNVTGRCVKMTNETGDVSYSIAVNLNDDDAKFMESLNDVIYKNIIDNSALYYDKKRSEAKIKSTYSPVCNYSKKDQELIKQGEEPMYGKSMFIKLYYTPENGLGPKIKNVSTEEVITDPENLIGGNIDIKEITFYNKHVWFGKKTSPSFMMSYMHYEGSSAQDVDMDSVALPVEETEKDETSSNKPKEEEAASDTDDSDDDDDDDDDSDEDSD